MADLYIDFDGLARTRENLDHVSELLHSPVDELASQAGSVTEIDRLRSRLQDFGDSWDYGIKKLGKYSEGVGEALQQIRDTFAQLDDKLAEVFDK